MTYPRTRLGSSPPSSEDTSANLALAIPVELIELIAQRAAAIVVEQLELDAQAEPWINVEGAAEHLACGTSRVYSLVSVRRIPHKRDGSRLLFRRSQLDEWLDEGGAKRP